MFIKLPDFPIANPVIVRLDDHILRGWRNVLHSKSYSFCSVGKSAVHHVCTLALSHMCKQLNRRVVIGAAHGIHNGVRQHRFSDRIALGLKFKETRVTVPGSGMPGTRGDKAGDTPVRRPRSILPRQRRSCGWSPCPGRMTLTKASLAATSGQHQDYPQHQQRDQRQLTGSGSGRKSAREFPAR